MRALWITTSLCLASTAVLAQPASQTVVGLDTCFKLVRVAEANCSSSADDAAQRPACLQNARKVQLECLKLAGPQASASVDRPQTAAGAVPSDRPAGAVSPVIAAGTSPAGNPVAGASADQKESESARTLAAAPSDKSVAATPPGMAAPSTSVPSGAQGSEWTVSETTSPVDYSPLVTATILARPDTKDAPMALVVRCRGRRTELGLRWKGPCARRAAAKSWSPTRSTISRWSSCAGLHPRTGRRRATGRMRSRCCSRFPTAGN